MRKRNVARITRTKAFTGTRGTVTTPTIIRTRKALATKVREAERLLHTIGELTAKIVA